MNDHPTPEELSLALSRLERQLSQTRLITLRHRIRPLGPHGMLFIAFELAEQAVTARNRVYNHERASEALDAAEAMAERMLHDIT